VVENFLLRISCFLLLDFFFQRKVTIIDVLKNWGISIVGNYAGCILYALFILGLGSFASDPYLSVTVGTAEMKLQETFSQVFLKGIAMGFMISFAIFLAMAADDFVGKIVGAFIPVICFVVSGYEHSIANIFFFHMAMFLGGKIGYGNYLLYQFLPDILGNIIGGSVLVGVVYSVIYNPPHHKKNKNEKKKVGPQSV